MPHVTEFIRPRLRSSFFLAALFLGLRLVPIAGAAIVDVNTLADEDVSGNGTCSLREAMTAAANQAAYHDCPSGTGSSDTITFSVTGLISLASPLPTVENILEIVGPGISSLTITGHDSVGMFFVDGSLNLHDLSLTNARAVWGAAIYVNDGQSLSVSRVLFLGNTATSSNGGAIYNDDASSIHITDSWFVDNFAQSGGAIYVGDSPTGATTITNSMFDGNEAFAGSGGAIANGSEGLVSIVNCTFTENTASARGGAVALLHNNNNLGHISITQATFAENSAGTSGGTLYADGVGVTVASSIISGSASCSGSIADGGYNVDDGLTCPFSSGTSLSLTNPQLDPTGRQPNGGETTTVALQTTSPAIDLIPVGVNGCGTSISTDERGFARPVNITGVSRCDAGAFELQVDNLDVTSAKLLRESKPGRANGSIKVKGDFQIPPIFSLHPPFSVRVQDSGTTDLSHTLTECEDKGGRVKCSDAIGDSRLQATFKPDRSDPSVYRFTVSFQQLALADPFAGPVTVTLTHNSVVLRRDTVTDCEQKKRGLDCREP